MSLTDISGLRLVADLLKAHRRLDGTNRCHERVQVAAAILNLVRLPADFHAPMLRAVARGLCPDPSMHRVVRRAYRVALLQLGPPKRAYGALESQVA